MVRYAIAIVALFLILSTAACSDDGVLIIAPDEYYNACIPLRDFKQSTGRPCYLVSLTEAYANFTGVDTPEQVKRCIAHYEHDHGVKHVILVGDIDKFPTRYTWWRVKFSDTNIQENYAVTDFYYADLYKGDGSFDDWDLDNDGKYGETLFSPEGNINDDEVHYLPEVAVGRIPASTADEVSTYVRKVIYYEMATSLSASWFKNASLYTGQANQSQPDAPPIVNQMKDECAASLTNKGFTITKRYWDVANQQPPANMPQAAINDFNAGRGFINYSGHGADNGWSCISLWDSSPGQPTDLTRGLSNTGKWPVVFAAACDTGMFAGMVPYKPYLDINGTEHRGTDLGETFTGTAPAPAPIQDDADHGVQYYQYFYPYDRGCLGEYFLTKYGNPAGSAGAIAYLGERTGGQVFSMDLDKFFYQAYDAGGHEVLGDAWRHMVELYYNAHNISQSSTWSFAPSDWIEGHKFTETLKFILFGDPSLVIGGAFRNGLCGTVYDGSGGPLASGVRYRMTCDVTVPTGQKLTANAGASMVVESGKKIKALDSGLANGLIVNGSSSGPVTFYLLPPYPAAFATQGVMVRGQMRLRNGGAIKFY